MLGKKQYCLGRPESECEDPEEWRPAEIERAVRLPACQPQRLTLPLRSGQPAQIDYGERQGTRRIDDLHSLVADGPEARAQDLVPLEDQAQRHFQDIQA